MKKQIILFIIICVGIVGAYHHLTMNYYPPKYSYDNNNKDNETKVSEAKAVSETTTLKKKVEEATTADPHSITLSFVGDLLLATNETTPYEGSFNDMAKTKDPKYFFSKVSKYFLSDDVTIGDCENVYSNSKKLIRAEKGQTANPKVEAYWFKTPAKNAKILKIGGIDLVSISNNHINDYGLEGHQDTRAALDKAKVKWGEEGKIVFYKKDGFTIAFICASMYSDYVLPNIKNYLDEASKKSDYQVLYFHGGEEATHAAEGWKMQACHDLIDYGYDLIIGDHPHVLQPMETYKGKTIIYSMGNFLFGGNRHPENRTIIYQHTLKLDSKHKLKEETRKIIPCYVYTGESNNWQPAEIKDEKTKEKILQFMKGKRKLP